MILLIDNYDSFVYNLKRYFVELGKQVTVKRHDAISIDFVDPTQIDGIVISPGPCSPQEAGISNELIRRFSGIIPILGVCLGHQCIGSVFGGNIVRANKPVHGKTSTIVHNDLILSNKKNGLFQDIPNKFNVMRYHSLVVDFETLPKELIKTAWLDGDDMIMGLQHVSHPTFGVQFHPESVLTEFGHKILENFLKFSKNFKNK